MTRCWYRHALVAAVLLTAAGCGGTHTVEGVVTFDNQPLHWATVTFTTTGNNGYTASGVTDRDGHFRLTTRKYGDGVPAGDYVVTVTVAAPPVEMEVNEKMTSTEVMAMYAKKMEERKKNPIKLPNVPALYGDPTQSPLRARVPTGGKVKLELHSDGRS
jgi:hypothetical protein